MIYNKNINIFYKMVKIETKKKPKKNREAKEIKIED